MDRFKTFALLALALSVCCCALPLAEAQPLSIDVQVSKDTGSPSSTATTPAFSTAASKELLLAFVSSDAPQNGPNTTVTGISGGGLTWQLVQRTNVQLGTAEIWRAFALTTVSNAKVAVTLSQSVASSVTVVSFIGADPSGINGSGAIGAVGTGNGPSGAPTASLVTTRNNSWVFGVGNDWDNKISRTLGPNQTMVHQYLAPVNDTYWVQSQTVSTPQSGTTVVINDTAPTTDRYNLSLVEVLPTQIPPPMGPISIDAQVSSDKSSASKTNTTPTFSTSAPNELLLAFVSSDNKTSPNTTVTGISGGGLTFQLVKRTNVQLGTAEVWRAFAATQLSNASVTVTLSQSVASSVTILSFIGVDPSGTNGSGAIGALGTGNGGSGAPSASLTTTRNYSWVFGAGNDWNNAISRTTGASQSLVHQYLATVNDTYWVQAQNLPTSQSGTSITINDTAPTSDSYNLSIVEVLPVVTGGTPLQISASASPAPNANGWNNTAVTVTFQCTGGVAPVQCPPPQVISTQGANQVVSGTATDGASNSVSTSVTLNISTTAPGITATLSPVANANGWNHTPVTVSYVCTVSAAPLTCPNSQTVSTQGANQPVVGAVTDLAGNTGSVTSSVSVDLTPPTITALASPPPGTGGINTTPVTVTFTCSDSLSGVSTCPPPITLSTSGTNEVISGSAFDQAGNVATASVTLNIRITPLSITASVSSAPNSAGWNNSNVTVTFQCSGGVAPVQCPSSSVVSAEDRNQSVVGTATDSSGAAAVATVSVSLDKTPPLINVTSPPNGSNVSTNQTTIQGLVSDALSGISKVNCGGSSATVTGNAFSCNVPLTLGTNTSVVTATDVAGNSSTSTVTLVYAVPINVQITTPTALQLFPANPITVTGTVSDPTSVVTVGGKTATLSGATFTVSGVSLQEGKNLLTASAVNGAGGVGFDTAVVYLDTVPPVIHIDNPAAGAVVTSSQIDVTGNVNDLVTGTVNGDQVAVVVNGVSATVANRTFAAHGVLLVPGSNTITAVATDRAGNISQNQVQVTLQNLVGQTLSIVSGNDQSGTIKTTLPQPLVVAASDSLGRPMANVPLNFAVAKSDGLILAGQQRGRQLTIQTGANGQASVQFQLGSRNGAGANQVSVSAPGFVGQAVFAADSTNGPAALISIVSGDMQFGAVGTPLPEPCVAFVSDSGGNPVSGVPVTFTVGSGGGLIAGGATFTQNTDSDGKAYATLILGGQEGINNNSVLASFSGLHGQSAVFLSSGVVPGPVANTIVSGIVLDNAEQPIANVTASIEKTNLSALTNAQGQFTIANAPVGDVVLFIDGSTSTSASTFPTLSFQTTTIPGINNTLGRPIYLPAIDTNNSQVVGGDQPVQLTMTGVPGVVYTVAPNSVTFPDGTHVGKMSVSQVHSDRVPMTPLNGTAPRLVATVQPTGVLFNPPMQIQLPNTDGLAPGQVVNIFSFHHDLEQFVVEGTARVSEDGSVVVSDPGFGLTVSGWDGGGPTIPQTPTCGDGCSNGCYQDAGCSNGQCTGDPTTIDSVDTEADGSDPDYVAFQKGGSQVAFTADPDSNCDNLQYDWDFGDGTAHSSTQNPTHTYMTAGSYEATVTVTCADCAGITFSSTVTANVMQITFDVPCLQNQASCDITPAPAMPTINLVAHIKGVDPDPSPTTTFQWTIKRQLDDSTCGPGVPIIYQDTNDVTASTTGGQYTPVFPDIFGGDWTIKATATVSGANITGSSDDDPTLQHLQIRGTNPDKATVQSSLQNEALEQIACRESSTFCGPRMSGQRQFEAAASQPSRCPILACNGDGGTGMMQITPGASDFSDMYDWTVDVAEGVTKFNTSLSFATAYDRTIAPSELGPMLTALNNARAAQKLPPVASPLSLPRWTTTGFSPPGDYGQLELDTIRGFNGFNGFDGYGHSLHEFKIVQNANGVPTVTIDPKTMLGTAAWYEVPASQRPSKGDTDYVNNVTNLSPLCP